MSPKCSSNEYVHRIHAAQAGTQSLHRMPAPKTKGESISYRNSPLDHRSYCQQCSRGWPCDHCRSRKAPHLCEFVQQANIRYNAQRAMDVRNPLQLIGGRSSRSSKISNCRPPPTSSTLTGASVLDSGIDLKTWGYMPDHEHFRLQALSQQVNR